MLNQQQKEKLVTQLNETRGGFMDKIIDAAPDISTEEFTALMSACYLYERHMLDILGLSEDDYGNISMKLGQLPENYA